MRNTRRGYTGTFYSYNYVSRYRNIDYIYLSRMHDSSASVHAKQLSGGKRTLFGGEEVDRFGDFVGIARSTESVCRLAALQELKEEETVREGGKGKGRSSRPLPTDLPPRKWHRLALMCDEGS